jgi:hypothetical protein
MACATGKFSDETGQTACTYCPSGKFNPVPEGWTPATVFTSSFEGYTSCSACSIGTYSTISTDISTVGHQDARDLTNITLSASAPDFFLADDWKLNAMCSPCKSKPENSTWTHAHSQVDSTCGWDCLDTHTLTHGGTKCGIADGAQINFHSSGTIGTLTMHTNGNLGLTTLSGVQPACIDPSSICATAGSGHGPADSHSGGTSFEASQLAPAFEPGYRRLGESEVSTRLAAMEARIIAIEAKLQ